MKKTAYVVFIFFLLIGCATFVLEDKNRPPQFSLITSKRSVPDQQISIPFMIYDENPRKLKITPTSSNQSIVKNEHIFIKGSDKKRFLEMKVNSKYGNSTINLNAQDDQGLSSSISFDLKVSRSFFKLDSSNISFPKDGDIKDFINFGTSVDIYGDYAVVVSGNKKYAIHIFKRHGDIWKQQTRFHINTKYSFQTSISIYHDLIAFGVPNSTKHSGEVFLFKRYGKRWKILDRIKPKKAIPYLEFGKLVDIHKNHIIISASRGNTFIFEKSKDNWIQKTHLQIQDSKDCNFKIQSIAIHDKYAVIGTHTHEGYLKCQEDVYILEKSDNSWSKKQSLTIDKPQLYRKYDSYSYNVDIYDNYVAIGAPHTAGEGKDFGAVYIFKNRNNQWQRIEKLIPKDVSIGDHFGSSVSLNHHSLLIGAIGEGRSGAAYMFKKYGESWQETDKFSAHKNTSFGHAIGLDKNHAILGSGSLNWQPIYLKNQIKPVYIFPNSSP